MEGSYKGRLLQWGIPSPKPSSLVIQFYVQAELFERDGIPLSPHQVASGYIVVRKKDGNLMVRQWENLQAALGWDGSGPKSLAEGDYSNLDLNFSIEWKEGYVNPMGVKTAGKLAIAWVNPPRDVQKADLDALEADWQGRNTAMVNQLKADAKLRPGSQTTDPQQPTARPLNLFQPSMQDAPPAEDLSLDDSHVPF